MSSFLLIFLKHFCSNLHLAHTTSALLSFRSNVISNTTASPETEMDLVLPRSTLSSFADEADPNTPIYLMFDDFVTFSKTEIILN